MLQNQMDGIYTAESNEREITNLSSPFKLMKKFPSCNNFVRDFAMVPFPDGKNKLIACSEDKTIRVYDDGKYESIVKLDSKIHSIHFFREKNIILTCQCGYLCVWDFYPEFEMINQIRISFPSLLKIIQISKNEFVTYNSSGSIFKIECIDNEEEVDNNDMESPTNDFFPNFSHEFKWEEIRYQPPRNLRSERLFCAMQMKTQKDVILFAGGVAFDFSIKVYDFNKKKITKKFSEHEDTVFCLSSFLDENNEEIIVSGGGDKLIVLWNQSGEIMKRIEMDGPVDCLLVDERRKGMIICGGSGKKNLYYFCLRRFKMMKNESKIHDSFVFAMDWMDIRKTKFVTCSQDKSFNIVEIEKPREEEEKEDLDERLLFLRERDFLVKCSPKEKRIFMKMKFRNCSFNIILRILL